MLFKLRNLRETIGRRPDHPLADAKELKRVVNALATESPFRAIDEISGWLESLSNLANPPARFLFSVAGQLDDAAQFHLRRILKDYLEQTRQARSDKDRLWRQCHDYWQTLIAVYERCFPPMPLRNADKENLAILCARLIAAFGALRKWDYFHYSAQGGDFWLRLGRVVALAEAAGVANQTVRMYQTLARAGSPQQEFVKVVAFQAASLESLTPVQIEIAERLIAHFSASFSYSARVEHDCVYWVDLAESSPPTRLARMPVRAVASQRFFKPAGAHDAMVALASDLEQGRGDALAAINLGAIYPPSQVLAVVRHLARYLAPIPPQRRHDRRQVELSATILAGREQILPLFSGQPPEALSTETWQVEDVSPVGVGAWLASTRIDWLKAGLPVAVRLAEGDWQLGVIRRHLANELNVTRIGIEILAQHPVRAELKPRALASYAGAPGVSALLLDDAASSEEVRALLPPGAFDARTALVHEMPLRRMQLTPIALMERTPDYDLARYRVAPLL